MIYKIFKKIYGNRNVDYTGNIKSRARENTSIRKLFRYNTKPVLRNGWILTSVKNSLKRLEKSIGGFRNTTSEKIKKFIKTQKTSKSNEPIKVATRAKDIIPEFLGKAPNLYQAETLFNPNIGKNKQENIAEGGFAVVQHAYAKIKNPHQNMSRLFVKKKIKKQKSNVVFDENQSNKVAGIDSKVGTDHSSIITEYGGETLLNLLKEEQKDTQTITTAIMIKDGTNRSMQYNRKKMSFETKVILARQLLTEISKLHKKDLIHGDIKASNILVDSKGKLSIIDFGGIVSVSSSPNSNEQVAKLIIGTLPFAPPEISSSQMINDRYDSWSAGRVIYQLFTGRSLLEGVHNPSVWNQQKKDILTKNIRSNVTNNPNIPKEAKILIYKLLDSDPLVRISATDALKLDLFTNQELYGKPSLIALSTKHDEKFKELARIEDELEKTSVTQLKKRQELEEQIKDVGSVVKKLQEKINKF